MKKEDNWIDLENYIDPYKGLNLDEVEVLFDSGEVCMYYDPWPYAIATHIREIS